MLTQEQIREVWIKGATAAPNPEQASQAFDDLIQELRFLSFQDGYQAGYGDGFFAGYEDGYEEGLDVNY